MNRFIILLLNLAYLSLHAQQTPDFSDFRRARVLKINILSPMVEAFTLAYENVLTPENSVQLTVNVFGGGFGVTPEFRFYLSESFAPKGVYIAPFLRYMVYEDESLAGGGLVIGTQGLFKDKITIDAFLGPSFNTHSVLSDNKEEELHYGLRAGVTVGLVLNRLKK